MITPFGSLRQRSGAELGALAKFAARPAILAAQACTPLLIHRKLDLLLLMTNHGIYRNILAMLFFAAAILVK
jgi:hypothetical protein